MPFLSAATSHACPLHRYSKKSRLSAQLDIRRHRSNPSFVRSPGVSGCDKRFIRTFNGNCSYSHDLPVWKNYMPRCEKSPIVSNPLNPLGVVYAKLPRNTDAVSSWRLRDLSKTCVDQSCKRSVQYKSNVFSCRLVVVRI